MTFTRTTGFLILLILLSQPLFALAGVNKQKDDWARVRNLASGTEITVETKAGAKSSGSFVSASDTALSFNSGGSVQNVDKSEIRSVSALTKKSRLKSIGIMAAIGAGVGGAIAAAALGATGGSDDTGSFVTGWLLIGAGAGAAAGAALGGGKKEKKIYEAK